MRNTHIHRHAHTNTRIHTHTHNKINPLYHEGAETRGSQTATQCTGISSWTRRAPMVGPPSASWRCVLPGSCHSWACVHTKTLQAPGPHGPRGCGSTSALAVKLCRCEALPCELHTAPHAAAVVASAVGHTPEAQGGRAAPRPQARLTRRPAPLGHARRPPRLQIARA